MAITGTQLDKMAQPLAAGPMGSGIFALWTRSRILWASIPREQRRWSLLAAVLLAALIGGMAWYGLRTVWRTLYAGLDPEDARQTGLTLTQAQIPFEVSSSGTAILVAAATLDKARLATAA